jgi:hypothetical protein
MPGAYFNIPICSGAAYYLKLCAFIGSFSEERGSVRERLDRKFEFSLVIIKKFWCKVSSNWPFYGKVI